MHRRLLGVAAAAVATAGLAAPALAQGSNPNLLDILNGSRDLRRFAALVNEQNLGALFARPGIFSAFIPHDAAFLDASPGRLQLATASPEATRRLVLNHLTGHTRMLLPGGPNHMEAGQQEYLTSEAGQSLLLMQRSGALPSVNGLRIYVANVRASNGVAHCIDGILYL